MAVSGLQIVLGLMLFSIFILAYNHERRKYTESANVIGAGIFTAIFAFLLWLTGAWG